MKNTFTVYRLPLVTICILLFFSCSPLEYPGFKKTSSGIFYKIHFLGDGKEKAQKGNYIRFSEKTERRNDSIPGEKRDTVIFMNELSYGDITECISLLAEGDSATFIFNDSGRMELKIIKIQTPLQYEEEQAYLAWKNDGEMNELKKLKKYLSEKKIDDSYLTDGIYFIPLKKGKGNMVEIGNTVVVHYRGAFPDSSVFDSTYDKEEPFEFKFGDDDQVIKGLELAICQMKKGEKAKIIIPSQLAFGEGGSSTGIVPPFTTVEYEVEIVNLK